jgi:hypothetical protein
MVLKKASEVIDPDLSVATPWSGDSVLQYRGFLKDRKQMIDRR